MQPTNPPQPGNLLETAAAANSSLARSNERTNIDPIVMAPGLPDPVDLRKVSDDYLDYFFRVSEGVGNLAIQVMHEQQRREQLDRKRNPGRIRELFEGPRTRRLV